MATIQELQKQYEGLTDQHPEPRPEADIDTACLLAVDYEYSSQDAYVVIDTDEFTAGCPWTSLPDFGTLVITYVPDRVCIELKSLKYYLLSYTGVGIVQEHAANRILNDLVGVSQPKRMTISLDYKGRGGLHTTVTARYSVD